MITEVHRQRRITGGMADNGEVLLNIPADMLADLQNATSEIPYVVGNAASIFRMLHKFAAGGFEADEGELCSLYELCGRGLQAVAEKEGEALTRLDMVLRDVMKPYAKKELDE